MSGFLFLVYFVLVLWLFHKKNVDTSLKEVLFNGAAYLFYLFLFVLIAYDALHYFEVVPQLQLVFNK